MSGAVRDECTLPRKGTAQAWWRGSDGSCPHPKEPVPQSVQDGAVSAHHPARVGLLWERGDSFSPRGWGHC